MAGVTTFSAGLPFDIFTATDTVHTGQPQRPDYKPASTLVAVSSPRRQTGPTLGLFSELRGAAQATFGRTHFYGALNSWDMVLQKTLSLSRAHKPAIPVGDLQLVQSSSSPSPVI